MPGIVRKLLVCASVDGLLLVPQKQHPKGSSPVSIEYASGRIVPASIHNRKDAISLEAYGIVGILSVASKPYLIAITSRKQVAQIKGKGVYVVSGVTIVPATSKSEAERVIQYSNHSVKSKSDVVPTADDEESSWSEEDLDSGNVTADDDDVSVDLSGNENANAIPEPTTQENSTSVAKDVIGRKGKYGRFAERWFSKKGWAVDNRRVSVSMGEKKAATPGPAETKDEQRSSVDSVAQSLLPKLLRTTRMLLSSRSFYFSYDLDITRRIGSQRSVDSDLPLSKAVDELFFWNESLSRPLADRGHHSYVLPLMQGYIGQRAFSVQKTPEGMADSIAHVKEDVGEVIELQETTKSKQEVEESFQKEWLLTLISRRSVLRPGLRYLRRGVDEYGHVANAVETEQILSEPAWSRKTYSFTQIRGSIPLFFSQSPYSFKPIPILHHSYPSNHTAFARHFANLRNRYGLVQVAMLVEKTGPEGKVGEKFAEHTDDLNEEMSQDSKIGFEWFDFHKICAGMKFEKVSVLIDTLQSTLASHNITIEQYGKTEIQQAGVLRTNCMDCLDRTNVVQSAVGAHSLQAQLSSEGIHLDIENDATTQWFNSIWADNGDAISKQYSSTAALKGDYTRTRKRDYRGALNDFGLTLSRYYNNIVNDYFSQAVIDYLLGNVDDSVFEEFENDMMTADPSMSMAHVRQNAIDTSAKIVIADADEELTGGWTVATPSQPNTLRSPGGRPMEEIVLLVTGAALYPVRFDWDTEKVTAFERITLDSLQRLRRGTYITSTLTAAKLDPTRNVGLVVSYSPAPQNLVRINTRSMSTVEVPNIPKMKDEDDDTEEVAKPAGTSQSQQENKEDTANADAKSPTENISSSPLPITDTKTDVSAEPTSDIHLIAFKALPARSSVASKANREGVTHQLSEQELVADIVDHIVTAVARVKNNPKEAANQTGVAKAAAEAKAASQLAGLVVEDGDIISVAEAKRSTGLLEQWGHTLKKFVWA